MNRHDLPDILYNAIKEMGGQTNIIDVCRYVWEHYQNELQHSGDLFYTWQYDIRWAATELRKSNRMKAIELSPRGIWEIMQFLLLLNILPIPERSIDIALSEYTPGRSPQLISKHIFQGGLFDYYTKFQKDKRFKAAKAWLELEEYRKVVLCSTNSLCGWFGINETYDECHCVIVPWKLI